MPKKDIIIVTGGAGFVGTNLIKLLLKKTKYKIVSLDDYSSGTKLNIQSVTFSLLPIKFIVG